MRRRILSAIVSVAMLASTFTAFTVKASAEANTPKYQTTARQMEELNRGLVAVKTTKDTREQTVDGVYLSWRLLGTESLENQAFDIYKNGSLLKTTGVHDATNYIDTAGSVSDKYKVVPAGADASNEPEVTPFPNNYYAKPSEVGNGNSLKNSFTYIDIPIVRPDPVERMGDGKLSYYYTVDKDHDGGANDASVGDIDGDGDYEIILKWDPTDSKDSAGADFTGNVYIDAYEIDPNNDGYLWRIDLGKNVTAGAHYTQFIVYDFDGDGRAEMACKTAPGSKDGKGNYVTKVGDTDAIRNMTDEDNEKQYIGTSGRLKGKNPFTQFLTVFDGETGEALWTTEYIPYELHANTHWGDDGAKYNRSERYLAGVAYLDGVHPSIIMCRGYYNDTVVRAYNWDGSELTMLWEHNASKTDRTTTMYGQGNHNLSIGDIDNDGYDEVVYGSAALDQDGKCIGNTYLGHGDAMHLNDFNNDGVQEVFSVKEDSEGFKHYAEDLRVAATGKHFWADGKITTSGDNGRGVMANVDDAYALAHPNALSLGWSSGKTQIHDLNGDDVAAKPGTAGSGSFDNSLVFWDGDLGRELLDANIIQKYDAANGWTKRYYGPSDGYTLTGGSTNNYTKRNASLSADLWGDWREEIIMPTGKGKDDNPALRIFTSTIPTDYRLTTLMHDSQYRCAIAWQNVGYNQPPHTSYYIGSAALATDESGNTLNYLAPAVPFTKVTYKLSQVDVTGVELSDEEVEVEKGQTVTVNASVLPSDASRKGIIWKSDNESIAKVSNGVITGVSEGTTTITATTRDGGYSATCTVNVFQTSVNDVIISDRKVELGVGYSTTISARVSPSNASVKTVKWESDDPSVATVTDDGEIKGISFGKTVVRAISDDGGYSAECIVKVKPIAIDDKTGDNVFVTDNTDNESVLSNSTATGATFTQKNAKVGGLFYKTFEAPEGGTARVSFKFTTGGTKVDGSNWNWTGHEFSLYVKLLGENDANILTLCQPFAAKAGTMTSQTGTAAADSFAKQWTAVVDNLGTVQGSAKRWGVNVEFDYDNNSASAVLYGYGDGFAAGPTAQYIKTFEIPEGVKFEKLAISSTLDNTAGDIVWYPVVEEVNYSLVDSASGNTEALYERGYKTPWSDSDLTDWTQTGTDTAALAYDSANKRIWYNPYQPGGEYSASRTFNIADNSLVTYDVDWYFGDPTGREANYEYIQFGSDIRLGWNSTYSVFASKDAGETYDTDSPVFEGDKATYTKNIKVVYDAQNRKVKSLTFDGKEITAFTDYELPEGATMDKVTFGFQRGGKPNESNVPTGIDRIKVSRFAYGEEAPDLTELEITDVEGSLVSFNYAVVGEEAANSITFIGALYGDGGKLEEIKIKTMDKPEMNKYVDDSIQFEGNASEKKLKLMMWSDVDGMVPLTDAAIR